MTTLSNAIRSLPFDFSRDISHMIDYTVAIHPEVSRDHLLARLTPISTKCLKTWRTASMEELDVFLSSMQLHEVQRSYSLNIDTSYDLTKEHHAITFVHKLMLDHIIDFIMENRSLQDLQYILTFSKKSSLLYYLLYEGWNIVNEHIFHLHDVSIAGKFAMMGWTDGLKALAASGNIPDRTIALFAWIPELSGFLTDILSVLKIDSKPRLRYLWHFSPYMGSYPLWNFIRTNYKTSMDSSFLSVGKCLALSKAELPAPDEDLYHPYDTMDFWSVVLNDDELEHIEGMKADFATRLEQEGIVEEQLILYHGSPSLTSIKNLVENGDIERAWRGHTPSDEEFANVRHSDIGFWTAENGHSNLFRICKERDGEVDVFSGEIALINGHWDIVSQCLFDEKLFVPLLINILHEKARNRDFPPVSTSVNWRKFMARHINEIDPDRSPLFSYVSRFDTDLRIRLALIRSNTSLTDHVSDHILYKYL